VQARVYAQGLTLAVLCASAAFEIHDQRKGQGLLEAAKKGKQAYRDSKDQAAAAPPHRERYEGEDMWKEMVAAEEQKLKERHQSVWAHERHKEEMGREKSKQSSEKDMKTADEEKEASTAEGTENQNKTK